MFLGNIIADIVGKLSQAQKQVAGFVRITTKLLGEGNLALMML